MDRTRTGISIVVKYLHFYVAGVLTACLILGAPPAWALPDSNFEGGDGDLENGVSLDWAALMGTGQLLIGVDEPPGITPLSCLSPRIPPPYSGE